MDERLDEHGEFDLIAAPLARWSGRVRRRECFRSQLGAVASWLVRVMGGAAGYLGSGYYILIAAHTHADGPMTE